jgi:pimeloyl-ACP methyl ester carboxylesterase
MGGSDWRDIYGFDGFAEDAEAVAQAAGLHAAGAKPIYIAHSFGGGLVLHAAATNPEQMAGAILVDTGFRPPPPQALEARLQQIAALRARAADQLPPRGFPSLAAAIARFRLLPAQAAENLYILDHIARTSFRRLPAAAGEAEVWTWKYDPDIAAKIDYPGRTVFFASQPEIAVPMAHLYGQYSQISAHGEEARGGPFPAHGLEVEIPEANHHVMIDQPLALVSALRTVLAAWRA